MCFNTSDIEYVVSWVDLASGGGLNCTTVERNFTIRTGVRGVYRVRITATVRGVSSVGGVTASWEDSRTEVLVHTGTYVTTVCGVCMSKDSHSECLTTAQDNPLLKVLRVVPVLDSHFIWHVFIATILTMTSSGV